MQIRKCPGVVLGAVMVLPGVFQQELLEPVNTSFYSNSSLMVTLRAQETRPLIHSA